MQFKKTLTTIALASTLAITSAGLSGCALQKIERNPNTTYITPEPPTLTLLAMGSLAFGAYTLSRYRNKK